MLSMKADARVLRSFAAAIGVSSVLWLTACGGGAPTAANDASAGHGSSTASTRSAARTETHSSTTTPTLSTSTASHLHAGTPSAARRRRRAASTSSTSSALSTRSALTTSTAATRSSLQPSTTHLRAAFAKAARAYAACLRRAGVHLPPRSPGHGPALDLEGLDTSSPHFQRAAEKCRGVVVRALSEAVGSSHSGKR